MFPKRLLTVATLAVVLSFTPAPQSDPFRQLQSLAGGTWTMRTAGATTCEVWKNSGARLLTAVSYRIKGKDTTQLETVALEQKSEGIFYTATAAGQNDEKPVSFKLVSSKDQTFIFSNPEHDFPQRIIYRLATKDSVHAWIEGIYNGKDIRRDFYFTRKH